MDQRTQFIDAVLKKRGDGYGVFTRLCRQFDISAKTGYKWLKRYDEFGRAGLYDRSRAPKQHGRATSAKICTKIIDARTKHKTWGPKKLKARLEEKDSSISLPAASTIGDILTRAGMTVQRPHRRRKDAPPNPMPGLTEAQQPNDVWTADYKGWFLTGDKSRCNPLTIQDRFSRYLITLRLTPRSQFEDVQPAFVEAFEEFGMPLILRTDNGTPFASHGLGGLSRLSIWLIKLGVKIERMAPGSPYQNGRHERFHRTLKADVASPPAHTLEAQRRRQQRYRDEYNNERPNEALGQKPPASVYTHSPRIYTGNAPQPTYADDWKVRYVRTDGRIKWCGRKLFVSQSLYREPLGMRQVADDEWLIYFAGIPLARLVEDNRIIPFTTKRGRHGQAKRK